MHCVSYCMYYVCVSPWRKSQYVVSRLGLACQPGWLDGVMLLPPPPLPSSTSPLSGLSKPWASDFFAYLFELCYYFLISPEAKCWLDWENLFIINSFSCVFLFCFFNILWIYPLSVEIIILGEKYSDFQWLEVFLRGLLWQMRIPRNEEVSMI